MKKIAWVTDSTAFMDEELRNHPDVYTIPLSILIDEEEYLDGIDLSPYDLFDKLKTVQTPPKTSQPSIGAFIKLYNKLKDDYDLIISILVSAKLSGTVSSSVQAANLVDIPVMTIDSKILTYPLSVQIKKGMEYLQQGLNLDEIKKKIESLRDTNEAFVLVGDLEQLHRSGRLSGLQFLLGSVLNIKPIISIEDGALSIKEKVRSAKKAKEKIVQYLRNSWEKHVFKEVYLLYGLHDYEANKWKEELKKIFPTIDFYCYPLGATIGVHAGEHTLGISWYNGLK